MVRVFSGALALCVLLGGCAVRAEKAPESAGAVESDRSALPQAVTGVEGMEKDLFQDGQVYIGGQPGEKSLASLAALGVTTVVNLRTPREMADAKQVLFDEPAEAARLGMEYVAIPIGGRSSPTARRLWNVSRGCWSAARVPFSCTAGRGCGRATSGPRT